MSNFLLCKVNQFFFKFVLYQYGTNISCTFFISLILNSSDKIIFSFLIFYSIHCFYFNNLFLFFLFWISSFFSWSFRISSSFIKLFTTFNCSSWFSFDSRNTGFLLRQSASIYFFSWSIFYLKIILWQIISLLALHQF